jgi:hypothetical protein
MYPDHSLCVVNRQADKTRSRTIACLQVGDERIQMDRCPGADCRHSARSWHGRPTLSSQDRAICVP